MLNYKPGPVGARFLASRARVKLICGPVGGGKSTLALMELVRRAVQQKPGPNGVRRTKAIILRNTMAQLKSTVKPLIDQWLVVATNNQAGQWRLTDNTFEMKFALPDGTTVHSELVMMAADTPDDVRRLLSMECSYAWIEECREVDSEVAESLEGRCNRFPNRASGGVSEPGLICSTNPPPMGSYWQEFMSNPPRKAEIFLQPAALLDDGTVNPEAENLENLAPDYYDVLCEGKSEAWIDVFLKNKFGSGGFGNPVFQSSFKRDFHVSKEVLHAISQSINPLIIGLDNGLTAAAVIGQQDMRGRVNILDECYVPEGTTMGVESFLDKLLIPKLRNEWPVRPDKVIFVVDPACFQRSQVDEKTIAMAIQQRGFAVKKAVTNDPERRIGAVEGLLNRQIDGGPAIAFSPKCEHIVQAMDFAYRYKKSASGLTTLIPEKNHASHIADALQYFCLHYNAVADAALMAMRPRAREVVKASYYWC